LAEVVSHAMSFFNSLLDDEVDEDDVPLLLLLLWELLVFTASTESIDKPDPVMSASPAATITDMVNAFVFVFI
jgi:hypothetical protein